MNYEIYEGRTGKQNRKKTYLVFNFKVHFEDVFKIAAKHFKCSSSHITFAPGWTFRSDLYFENPQKKGTKQVWVAYWI